ncbi:MAG: energy-coupling factor transporter ATPase [Erysipelotrichaceae bacterium]|nr:energy-coupling factor transporter ATPase [Erysipelotrichaceae bacterium]MDD3923803.1 energy-coupling factor transporter ATPase [Erysipelotrichaceae bacterium]MDD4641880.1 energy-coupling factor transporter ATPase [Erysipelotrichaceae bacterium]
MPISFKEVSYTYSPKTPFAYEALKGVNVNFTEGKITAIIGSTGSGKTTLVQHLNALLLPSAGEIEVLDRKIKANIPVKDLKSLRKMVGLVFQFPEYQLFEETILKDVCFGPLNFGIEPQEAIKISKEMLRLVGLDESYDERSPLELSGGQKRKVAIAGILAINPQILVLDEPVAGLDPQSSKAMMKLFVELNRRYNKTILIVTHNMEHVLAYSDDVVVVDQGSVIRHVTKDEFFMDDDILNELKIAPPAIINVKAMLKAKGIELKGHHLDLESLTDAIVKEIW